MRLETEMWQPLPLETGGRLIESWDAERGVGPSTLVRAPLHSPLPLEAGWRLLLDTS